MSYNLKKIKKKYISLGLKKSQNLYITADFGKIMKRNLLKPEVVEIHYKVIKEIIGIGGTIIVPTATLNLCKTDKIFNPKQTPSFNMGSFSELVRKKKGRKKIASSIMVRERYRKIIQLFYKGYLKTCFWIRLYMDATYKRECIKFTYWRRSKKIN